jgi:toxin-antitoxin system PIN domain toxin
MTQLLDANALIALCWPTHEHHPQMRTWFRQHAKAGWATTAFTQAAFVRIVCQQVFAGRAIAVAEVAELLLRNTAHPKHQLAPMDFGFADVMEVCTGGILGHRQITDAWLLTAAVRGKMRLLTFDKGITQLLSAPRDREKHVTLLGKGPE